MNQNSSFDVLPDRFTLLQSLMDKIHDPFPDFRPFLRRELQRMIEYSDGIQRMRGKMNEKVPALLLEYILKRDARRNQIDSSRTKRIDSLRKHQIETAFFHIVNPDKGMRFIPERPRTPPDPDPAADGNQIQRLQKRIGLEIKRYNLFHNPFSVHFLQNGQKIHKIVTYIQYTESQEYAII